MLTSKIIHSFLPVNTNRVFIAYSGGVDSHVLLHLASLDQQLKPKVTAVYVNHGLQAEANAWADHCQKVSVKLGVQSKCLNVNAHKAVGQSQEEVARNVRYDVLKALLQENDVLLLAQHREDQMETVLLQLFRGAGVKGLSGMPVCCSFGAGVMCRPLLDVSQQTINDYAQQNGLEWIEDSSNLCDDFDRNFLRNQVLPQLKKRWPSLDKTISRSARHCAASQAITQDVAQALFEPLYNSSDETLDISKLLAMETADQSLVIRQWFSRQQLRMPAEKTVKSIVNEVINAQASANPKVEGLGYCIRRYRNKLFCLKNSNSDDASPPLDVVWEKGLAGIKCASGQLTVANSDVGVLKALWDKSEVIVSFRKGSEKIKLPGRVGHHTLKKLFQERGIPPWQRNAIPLIYINDQLAVIANLWVSADFYSDDNAECYQIRWKQQ